MIQPKFILFSALLGLFTACKGTNFPDYVLLGDLRVLTIQALANQSEVNPGTTVTLQPVISDLNGGGRTLNVVIQTCPDPGIGLGARALCVNPDTTTNSSFSTTTLGTNSVFTGNAPTFTVTVPATTPGYISANPVNQYNGVAYLVVYTVMAPDGTSVTAYKRIMVSSPTKTGKNLNPAVGSVSANGVNLAASSAYSTATINLAPNFSVAAETYQFMNPDGTLVAKTESLTTTWFVTDGTMEFQRTINASINQWQPATKPSTRSAAMVVVTHDGRNGEGYQIFEFN